MDDWKAKIIERVAAADWSRGNAVLWYSTDPLPGFGGCTAEQLVDEGKGEAVWRYLDEMDLGGFA